MKPADWTTSIIPGPDFVAGLCRDAVPSMDRRVPLPVRKVVGPVVFVAGPRRLLTVKEVRDEFMYFGGETVEE